MGITYSPSFFLGFIAFFGFTVQTYLKHNPFGTIKSIIQSDPYYKMLFENYSDSYDAMYYTKAKLF